MGRLGQRKPPAKQRRGEERSGRGKATAGEGRGAGERTGRVIVIVRVRVRVRGDIFPHFTTLDNSCVPTSRT
jgi:hypothetical protein